MIVFSSDFNSSGGGSDTAFQTKTDCSFPCSHIALLKISGGGADGRKNVGSVNSPILNVIQMAVIAFTCHGIEGKQRNPFFLTAVHNIAHKGIMDQPHIQRVGQRNGRFQSPQLVNLNRSRCLPETIQNIGCRGQLLRKYIILTGENHSNPCLVSFRINCTVSHRNTGDIPDGIAFSCGKRTDTDSVITDSSAAHRILPHNIYLKFTAVQSRAVLSKPALNSYKYTTCSVEQLPFFQTIGIHFLPCFDGQQFLHKGFWCKSVFLGMVIPFTID